MSVKTFDNAPSYVHADEKAGVINSILGLFTMLNRGVTMAHDYQEMVARGMSPESASRKVLETMDRH